MRVYVNHFLFHLNARNMLNIFITIYLLHVSVFVTPSSARPLLYLLKKLKAFCNVATKCTTYQCNPFLFRIYNVVAIFKKKMYFVLLYLKNLKNVG